MEKRTTGVYEKLLGCRKYEIAEREISARGGARTHTTLSDRGGLRSNNPSFSCCRVRRMPPNTGDCTPRDDSSGRCWAVLVRVLCAIASCSSAGSNDGTCSEGVAVESIHCRERLDRSAAETCRVVRWLAERDQGGDGETLRYAEER